MRDEQEKPKNQKAKKPKDRVAAAGVRGMKTENTAGEVSLPGRARFSWRGRPA
jgi:hypothetical protein